MAPCPPPPISGTSRVGLRFSLKPRMATRTYTQALDKESFLLHGRRGQSTLPRDSRRSLKPQQTLGKCPWGATVGGGLPPPPSFTRPREQDRVRGGGTKAPWGLSRFQGSHHPCLPQFQGQSHLGPPRVPTTGACPPSHVHVPWRDPRKDPQEKAVRSPFIQTKKPIETRRSCARKRQNHRVQAHAHPASLPFPAEGSPPTLKLRPVTTISWPPAQEKILRVEDETS